MYKSVLLLNSGDLIPHRLNEVTHEVTSLTTVATSNLFWNMHGSGKFAIHIHSCLHYWMELDTSIKQENYFLVYGYTLIFSSRETHCKYYGAKISHFIYSAVTSNTLRDNTLHP